MNTLVQEVHALALKVLAENENLRVKLDKSERYVTYLLKAGTDITSLELALEKTTELVMQQEAELEKVTAERAEYRGIVERVMAAICQ